MFKYEFVKMAVKDGKIFSVTFKKRTTGECRKMICKINVKSHLRGGHLNYKSEHKNLLIVYDMQKKDYRSVPIDAIISLKINGTIYSN